MSNGPDNPSWSLLWAGWRSEFVEAIENPDSEAHSYCPFCLASDLAPFSHSEVDADSLIVRSAEHCLVMMNLYPYGNGHMLVMPRRHLASLTDLTLTESLEMWQLIREAELSLRTTIGAHGVNVGMNLSRAAGAAIPDHLHAHVLPRWVGDTNFTMTTASVRVISEALSVTRDKLREGWRQLQ